MTTISNKNIIILKWKEDNMEKVGFYDQQGEFHMLFGIAKDWQVPSIHVINTQTGKFDKYTIKELD